MRIDVTTGSLEDVLAEGFRTFNAPHIGPHGWTPLQLSVFRDGETRPAGGIVADCYAAWVHVRMFWLPEDLRHQGLGARLLRDVEREAAARGCIGAYLDTFSFQARPFYEKQGYRQFGELPDCPPGGARYFMMKRFDGAAGETHVQA